MRFGVHVSIAGGPRKTVDRAVERGCETIQVFSSNPRGWRLSAVAPGDDETLRDALAEKDIFPVLLHTPYLVNLAAPDTDIYTKSVGALAHAAQRAVRLAGVVVVHAGRDRTHPRGHAVDRAAAALLAALKLVPNTRILVEPTAGGAGAVASTPEELGELLEVVADDRIGVCLDTCHAFASGASLADPSGARAWIDAVESHVGWDRVDAVHTNDSRDPCGSNRDRHWHLGEGEIGEAGFRTILTDSRLHGKAIVCETPGKAPEDLANLARARDYAGLG